MKNYEMEGSISKIDPIKQDGKIVGYRVGINMGNGAIGFVSKDRPGISEGASVRIQIEVTQ